MFIVKLMRADGSKVRVSLNIFSTSQARKRTSLAFSCILCRANANSCSCHGVFRTICYLFHSFQGHGALPSSLLRLWICQAKCRLYESGVALMFNCSGGEIRKHDHRRMYVYTDVIPRKA